MQLACVVEYVADMRRAVAFYRDGLGLALRFESESWSEFECGAVPFALEPADALHPAGTLQARFTVPDIHQFHGEAAARGVEFLSPPTAGEYGTAALVRDSEGAVASVSRR